MRSLAILTQAMVARGQAEVADWAAVARDLGTVTNQPLMLRSDKDKDLYYAVAKEVAETSRHHDNYPRYLYVQVAGLSAAVADTSRQLDVEVNQRILMLGDVVAAYSDMVDRHDKGLAREHKLAAEKIGMVKCRDLRGGLATDTELRDQLESNIGQHEITLTDLETRQVRSSHLKF